MYNYVYTESYRHSELWFGSEEKEHRESCELAEV